MNSWLHNDKIIPHFCYNVPIFPVLHKINRGVYVVLIFLFQLIFIFPLSFGMVMYVKCHDSSTLYKKDTSLRRTASAVPEGCVRRELTVPAFLFLFLSGTTGSRLGRIQVFIRGGSMKSPPPPRRGVWGYPPPENFEILSPRKCDFPHCEA